MLLLSTFKKCSRFEKNCLNFKKYSPIWQILLDFQKYSWISEHIRFIFSSGIQLLFAYSKNVQLSNLFGILKIVPHFRICSKNSKFVCSFKNCSRLKNLFENLKSVHVYKKFHVYNFFCSQFKICSPFKNIHVFAKITIKY